MRFRVLVLLTTLVWTLNTSAQQTPTFRNAVELVVVDVLVTSADGSPVAELTPSDLRLTIDGKPREIESLQFIRATSATAAARSTLPSPGPTVADGRRFVIVVNHESIYPGQERPVIDAATRFVGRLKPNDEVAVVTLPRGRIESNFSRARGQTVSALQRVTGRAPAMRDVQCADIKALRTFADGLRLDTIASLVLVSADVSSSATEPQCRGDFEDLVRMLNRREARVFAIRPAPVQQLSERASNSPTIDPLDLPGLSSLTNMTGGRLFAPSGSVDEAFETIDRSTSAYYLLAFAPEGKDRDGKPHRISVTTTRSGTEVRARSEFQLSK